MLPDGALWPGVGAIRIHPGSSHQMVSVWDFFSTWRHMNGDGKVATGPVCTCMRAHIRMQKSEKCSLPSKQKAALNIWKPTGTSVLNVNSFNKCHSGKQSFYSSGDLYLELTAAWLWKWENFLILLSCCLSFFFYSPSSAMMSQRAWHTAVTSWRWWSFNISVPLALCLQPWAVNRGLNPLFSQAQSRFFYIWLPGLENKDYLLRVFVWEWLFYTGIKTVNEKQSNLCPHFSFFLDLKIAAVGSHCNFSPHFLS